MCKDQWAIHKAHQNAHMAIPKQKGSQANANKTQSSNNSTSTISTQSEAKVGWAGVHCSYAEGVNLCKMILLDSDSTDMVFCNPDYVTIIQDSKQHLIIETNGRPISVKQKCDILNLGEVWYNMDSIANIVLLSNMADKLPWTWKKKDP
jgi:hypothetical protein